MIHKNSCPIRFAFRIQTCLCSNVSFMVPSSANVRTTGRRPGRGVRRLGARHFRGAWPDCLAVYAIGGAVTQSDRTETTCGFGAAHIARENNCLLQFICNLLGPIYVTHSYTLSFPLLITRGLVTAVGRVKKGRCPSTGLCYFKGFIPGIENGSPTLNPVGTTCSQGQNAPQLVIVDQTSPSGRIPSRLR